VSKYTKLLIKNIRSLMDQAGWNQADLAVKLGIARQNLANYLAGKNSPSIDSLGLIAETFGVTIADLFATDEVPAPKVHVEKTTLPDEIRSAIQTENSKLMGELVRKLGPVLASLEHEHGVEEVIVRKAPSEKLETFINRLLQEVGVDGDFYRLLDEDAKESTLRVEFLRNLIQGTITAGGPASKEVRKMLTEIMPS
jgi:transcriptional regulator with XRE-family HTH domain